jgi:hypothetical protein
MQYLTESFDPKCDFCQLPSSSNPNGIKEDLLICKDCNAKAHPSCMQYTEELAIRSRLAPWQCIDCKTCANCEDSGDWDFMLFCDLCDKGYHMSCHIPPLDRKPNGKWVCTDCLQKEKKRPAKADEHGNGDKDNMIGESCDVLSIHEEPTSKNVNSKSEKTVLRHLQPQFNDMLESHPSLTAKPQQWTVDDVASFVKFIGFPDQSVIFKEQEIDGVSLMLLKRMDILTGLCMKLGPALKIFGHVQRLQNIHADG